MRFNTEQTKSDIPNNNLESLTSSLNELEAKKEQFNQLKKNLIEQFRESLNELASDIFKNIAQLKAISWVQYTPYFNDGDQCVFRIREVIFYNFIPESYFSNSEEIDDEEYPEHYWAESAYTLKKHTASLSEQEIKFLLEFDTVMNANSEFIQEIFGDHCKVVWNADGITVSDYSNHY